MSLIGCHVSITGGVENAPQRASELGCDTFQIFTANQMQWKSAPVSEQSRSDYLVNLKIYEFQTVVSHDSYLINLGGHDPKKLALSRRAFIEEIKRSTFLKIPYMVFHPGSHLGKGDDFALNQIAESLDYCIEKTPGSDVMLLLENTSGQGSNVGYRFEHLQTIIEKSSYPERLGVCFDTCHAFTSGYDLVTTRAYDETFDKFDAVIGLEHLKVFHLNDSKKALGSRIDRHQQLGKGFIGIEPFYRLVNDPRFEDTPMILETPGDDAHYAREIQLLKDAVK